MITKDNKFVSFVFTIWKVIKTTNYLHFVITVWFNRVDGVSCSLKQSADVEPYSRKKRTENVFERPRKKIRKKHRSWEKYRCKQDSESYKEYTKARKKAKSIITRERRNREKQIAETAKSNSKHFWSYVNSKRKTKSGVFFPASMFLPN
jgi:hypothetical protein